jgi:hypothetical protein
MSLIARTIVAALLAATTLSTAAYAQDCGFSDPAYRQGPASLYGGTSSNEGIDGLDANFQSALSDLISAARMELGGNLMIFSGFRSIERQTQLWEGALKKYGSASAARKWVAPPGSSNHNFGKAVDMRYNGVRIARPSSIDTWLSAKLGNFGLNRPMSWEPWHVEPNGTRGPGASASAFDAGVGEAGGACDGLEMPAMALMPWVAPDYPSVIPPGAF